MLISVKDLIVDSMNVFYQEIMKYEYGKLYGADWLRSNILPRCQAITKKSDKYKNPTVSKYADFIKKKTVNAKVTDIDVTFACGVLMSKDFAVKFSRDEKDALNDVRRKRNEFQHMTGIDEKELLALNKSGIKVLEKAMRVFHKIDTWQAMNERVACCQEAINNRQNVLEWGTSSGKGDKAQIESLLRNQVTDKFEQDPFYLKQYKEAEKLLRNGNRDKAIQIFESLAYASDVKSMYMMSELYIRDILLETSDVNGLLEKAYMMCAEAVEAGMNSAEARRETLKRIVKVQQSDDSNKFVYYLLADMFESGEAVKEDINLAVLFYLKALERGNILAQYKLSELLYEGITIEKAAVTDLADKINIESCKEYPEDIFYRLCSIICVGTTSEEKQSDVLQYLRDGIEKGSSYAIEEFVTCFLCEGVDDSCIKVSLEERKKVAEQGYLQEGMSSAYYLGNIYVEGIGVEQNLVKGIEYFEKAHSLGDKRCEMQLAEYYCKQGTVKSLQRAETLLQSVIMDKDTPQAKVLFFEVVDSLKSYISANKKQENLAGKYLIEAADTGYVPAYYYLGYCYYTGFEGIKKDREKAEKYYVLYRENGQDEELVKKVLPYLCKATAMNGRDYVTEAELEEYYGTTPNVAEIWKAKELLCYYSRRSSEKFEQLSKQILDMIEQGENNRVVDSKPKEVADIYHCIAETYFRRGSEEDKKKAKLYYIKIYELCLEEREIPIKFQIKYLEKYYDAFGESACLVLLGLRLCEVGDTKEGLSKIENAYAKGSIWAAQIIVSCCLEGKYVFDLEGKDEVYNHLEKLYNSGNETQKQYLWPAVEEKAKFMAYRDAMNYMKEKSNSECLEKAIEILQGLGEYRDAKEHEEACRQGLIKIWYARANELFGQKQSLECIQEASGLFEKCEDYLDSKQLLQQCKEWYEEKEIEEAVWEYITLFEADLSDATELLIHKNVDLETVNKLLQSCKTKIQEIESGQCKEIPIERLPLDQWKKRISDADKEAKKLNEKMRLSQNSQRVLGVGKALVILLLICVTFLIGPLGSTNQKIAYLPISPIQPRAASILGEGYVSVKNAQGPYIFSVGQFKTLSLDNIKNLKGVIMPFSELEKVTIRHFEDDEWIIPETLLVKEVKIQGGDKSEKLYIQNGPECIEAYEGSMTELEIESVDSLEVIDCPYLETLVINGKVKRLNICNEELEEDVLENVILNGKIDYAIIGVRSIRNLEMNEAIEHIQISGCDLSEIRLPDGTLNVILQDMSNLEKVVLPDTVEAFKMQNCASLKELVIPDSVNQVWIENCNELENLVLPEKEVELKIINCTLLEEAEE